mmetsp:Transcript_56268/g.163118  ORF Transcript_56268/g.163118 Transcript_56268/m.163118 type:complete len:327 (+) Transcript_56268:105-1085(+)
MSTADQAAPLFADISICNTLRVWRGAGTGLGVGISAAIFRATVGVPGAGEAMTTSRVAARGPLVGVDGPGDASAETEVPSHNPVIRSRSMDATGPLGSGVPSTRSWRGAGEGQDVVGLAGHEVGGASASGRRPLRGAFGQTCVRHHELGAFTGVNRMAEPTGVPGADAEFTTTPGFSWGSTIESPLVADRSKAARAPAVSGARPRWGNCKPKGVEHGDGHHVPGPARLEGVDEALPNVVANEARRLCPGPRGHVAARHALEATLAGVKKSVASSLANASNRSVSSSVATYAMAFSSTTGPSAGPRCKTPAEGDPLMVSCGSSSSTP